MPESITAMFNLYNGIIERKLNASQHESLHAILQRSKLALHFAGYLFQYSLHLTSQLLPVKHCNS